jgi:rhodanese-related sulfurtransferase
MRKKLSVVVISLLVILSMVTFTLAQSKKPAGPPPVVQEMIKKAQASMKTASADEVKAVVEKKSTVILMDVRTSGEWAAGHLPGAIHVDRGLLEFIVWKAIPDQNAQIIVYCKTGGRATLATKTMLDLGYKNTRVAAVTYEAWVKAGNPVVR